MWRMVIGIAVLAGGCLSTPGRPTERAIDAGADGRTQDGAQSACTMPSFSDPFDTAGACPPGSLGSNVSLVSRSASALQLQVNTGSMGTTMTGCIRDNYNLADTTFIEVSAVNRQATGYTILQIYYETDGKSFDIAHYNDTDELTLSDDTGRQVTLPWNATTMRWWRLRPVGTSELAGDYSSNGQDWQQLGTVTLHNHTTTELTHVQIGSAHYASTASAIGTATIEGWNVCP